jgi:NadR type nicotinamide-nucleotide adenylyltransferase
MLKRIAITGPESTGKTWLAKKLANYFRTAWVHEFAVDYLSKHGADYNLEDILRIAKGQVELENNIANIASQFLFCDTDLIVTKIWSKEVFNEVPLWIDEMIAKRKYDLYLLCSPDLEWEDAPFRENANDRDRLFNLYQEELVQQNFNFRIIKGVGDQRLKNAVNFVEELIDG